MLLSKTRKQTTFPIKTFYDIEKNYNLKSPTIKGCKLSWKRWGGDCHGHLVYNCWCFCRVLFNCNAGLFSS